MSDRVNCIRGTQKTHKQSSRPFPLTFKSFKNSEFRGKTMWDILISIHEGNICKGQINKNCSGVKENDLFFLPVFSTIEAINDFMG